MLKVRIVTKYDLPKYPKGLYYQKPPPHTSGLFKRGAATLAMLALLESCSDKTVGTAGPPPVWPEMVTENEAHQIIGQVFANNGLSFEQNVPFKLHLGLNDSTELELDVFNDSLQVGFEYIADTDSAEFDEKVIQTLDNLFDAWGPYIKTMDTELKFPNYRVKMEEIVQEFIDTLKARGVI
jgi:hypothetical protein